MSLNFLPRKLQQRTSKHPTKNSIQSDSGKGDGGQLPDQFSKGKQKERSDEISDKTILTLLKLAFSDYNLNKDKEFRELLSSKEEPDCKIKTFSSRQKLTRTRHLTRPGPLEERFLERPQNPRTATLGSANKISFPRY
jgi:hypothetical protein